MGVVPWPVRLLAIAAIAAGGLLLAAGGALVARGATGPGILVLAATAAVALSLLQILWVRFDLSPTASASLRRGDRRSRHVVLTFDDGPGPDTPAVLDALDAAGVRATFFMLGDAAAARPELAREVARRGHLVASHGRSHRKLHLASPRTIAAEIDGGLAALRAAGVEPAPLFRAPHGFKGPLLTRALRRRGLRLVGWTRGAWDSARPGAGAIVERACARPRGGTILLLHDGNGTPGIDPRRDQTAAAIPEIVRRWRAAGYEFTTPDQLEPEPHPLSPGRLLRWAALAALIAFSAAAARKLDPAEIQRAFAEASGGYLLAAALANVVSMAMQTGRWLAIVHPIEPRARPRDAFFSLVAGYAIGLVVPARASDLARAHLMARRSGASMATLTATAVVDHLLGSVALFGALGLFAALSDLPVWLRSAGTVACGGAIAALASLWLLRPKRPQVVAGHGLGAVVARLRQGLVAVGRPRALAISWLFAVGGWTAELLIADLSLRAFGLPSGLEPALLAVLATTLSAAASVSPGNAGAFEIACVVALAGLGVPREPALAFAIGYHAVHLVPTALIGGGWLLAHGYRSGALRAAP